MPWGTINRRALPSPDLGGKALADVEFDDARRPRALCVEYLRREPNQTFRAADAVLAEVNARFANLPEWKKATFSARYFKVDRDILEECLVLRAEGERLWLYLSEVYDDERNIEDALTKLAGRADIELTRPFDSGNWRSEIRDTKSPLLGFVEVQFSH